MLGVFCKHVCEGACAGKSAVGGLAGMRACVRVRASSQAFVIAEERSCGEPEFPKIVKQRGLLWNCPTGALASRASAGSMRSPTFRDARFDHGDDDFQGRGSIWDYFHLAGNMSQAPV